MGKCIVCNKSAGPFYSLHKACLPRYRESQQCLKAKLAAYLSPEEKISVSDIQSCRPSENFSEFYFKQIFIKAWQEHAKQVVSHASLNISSASKLVHLASEFDVSKSEVEPFLLLRLLNIEHLEALQNKQTIRNPVEINTDSLELNKNENVIWQFENTDKSEPQQYSQEKTWTIFNSLLDNLFRKSRYKPLDVKVEESGKLFVTNQGLHYLYGDSVKETKYSDMHSVTPMKYGIRVQAIQSNATPDTYITGDGRFTYALLQYAQGKKLR